MQVATGPCWSTGPSRRYLCGSFPRCLGPYHDGLQVALACYFPCNIGLPQKSYGSAYRNIPLNDFTAEGIFEVAAIPLCSGLSVCSPPWSLPPCKISYRADGDFYVRARHASLPPHAPDMLAVRHRQLTARGLSPRQTRSLVGCSALSSPTTMPVYPGTRRITADV